MSAKNLPDLLDASASRYPDRAAIVDATDHEVTYAALAGQADALARFLAASGVAPGDRVGVVLPKSIAGIVSLFGIMKAGAAYVPVDPTGPAERGRQILTDCGVRAVIVDSRALKVVPPIEPIAIVVSGSNDVDIDRATTFDAALAQGGPSLTRSTQSTDLAYILYTSGSTGTPKGVMISHANVLTFLTWCSEMFAPTPDDRFSSHAPFHFDASVFDIYAAI
jgi:non-ribosomal peptide synthetase component F